MPLAHPVPSAPAYAYPVNDVACVRIAPHAREASWRRVQRALRARSHCPLTDWGARLLRDGLSDDVGSVVIEPFYVCKDHANLYSHFYSKKFIDRPAHTARLHFFRCPKVDIAELMLWPEDHQPDYIGYSVIRPVAERCIGRTLIDPFQLWRGRQPHFYTLRTRFGARLLGADLSVEGFPYASQDVEAALCGQTALWNISRYLSERYPQYREQRPYDLITLTRTRLGRVVPHRGMDPQDYADILSELGTHPIIVGTRSDDNGSNTSGEGFRDVCTYLESGMPVLASFGGHAAALIGHTMDLDLTPEPDADGLVDHTHFFNALVMHDDNRFPYAKLSRRPPWATVVGATDTAGEARQPRFIEDMVAAVCPLPEKVYLQAPLARNRARETLNLRQSRRQLVRIAPPPYVTRLFFTTSTALKQRKLDLLKQDTVAGGLHSAFVAQLHLPHFVWVLEVSSLEGFRQGKCCAEIVLDATAGSRDDPIIYCRIGEVLNSEEREIRSAGAREFPQFVHNLKHFTAPT